jgi:hypothetical protein
MNSPTTLKISLENDIRRVAFVANDFQILKKQISELFVINEDSFVVKYKDDEGDLISICSNEEYKESILCCQDKILRIFVFMKNVTEKKKCRKFRKCPRNTQQQTEKNNTQVPPPPQPQHETFNPFAFFQSPVINQQSNMGFNPLDFLQNIFEQGGNGLNGIVDNLLNSDFIKIEHNNVCDGCDTQISGTRYHCKQCPDFDFCSSCFETKLNTHDSNHIFQPITPFVALQEAISNNEFIEPIIRGGKATDPVEKKIHNAFCDRCDQKIVGLRWKCFDCNDFDFCNACYLVANGKESIKTHLNTHVFGKIEDPLTWYSFQIEKEKHFEEKQEKEKIEQQRIEKEKIEQERIEKEKIEQERIEKEKIEQQRIEKEKSESKIVYPFEQKLQDLNMMGFTDRKKCIQVLIKNKGDIAKALEDLLQF